MYEVYHFVPQRMTGHVLYPLNQLREIDPETYELAAGKYRGRESLMKRTIPPLDCLWNDVLHFSPIHPETVRDELMAAGITWRPMDVFAIDPGAAGFSDSNSVFFDIGDTLADAIYTPFDPKRLADLRTMPEKTREHYRSPDKPYGLLTYLYVTHVLHRGSIDTRGVRRLRVD